MKNRSKMLQTYSCVMTYTLPGVVVHAYKISTLRQMQEDQEFKVILSCTAN